MQASEVTPGPEVPMRVQRSRAKGSRLVSPNGLPVVCVTRPGRWGNPFAPGTSGPMGRVPIDKAGAVGFFRDMLRDTQLRAAAGYPPDDEIRRELRGKNLACWCNILDKSGNPEPCHADVLLELANS